MSADDDDHPPSTQHPLGHRPRRPEPGDAGGRGDTPLHEAYAFALAQMANAVPAAPGYRLFWVRAREAGWMDLPDGGPYAVIGHHPACDVSLAEVPGVWLRHLIAMTVRLADGLALRILDLHTPHPFRLADGMPQRSVVVCGPVAFRLGEYVIGGVPIEEDGSAPGKLRLPPGELPRSELRMSDSLPRSVRAPVPTRPVPSAPPSESSSWQRPEVTRVTSMPPSLRIGQTTMGRARRAAPSPGSESLSAAMLDELGAREPGCAWVTLRRDGRSAGVELSETELDLGVMVGRSDNCHDGLFAVLDTNVSRGHVLLLHHHGVFEAFDLCSTQGTYVGGEPVRRVVLPDEGISLRLASKAPVQMEWKRKA